MSGPRHALQARWGGCVRQQQRSGGLEMMFCGVWFFSRALPDGSGRGLADGGKGGLGAGGHQRSMLRRPCLRFAYSYQCPAVGQAADVVRAAAQNA